MATIKIKNEPKPRRKLRPEDKRAILLAFENGEKLEPVFDEIGITSINGRVILGRELAKLPDGGQAIRQSRREAKGMPQRAARILLAFENGEKLEPVFSELGITSANGRSILAKERAKLPDGGQAIKQKRREAKGLPQRAARILLAFEKGEKMEAVFDELGITFINGRVILGRELAKLPDGGEALKQSRREVKQIQSEAKGIPQRAAKILLAFEKGETMRPVFDELGITPNHGHRILAKELAKLPDGGEAIKQRRREATGAPLPMDIRATAQKIASAFERGLGVADICKETGVDAGMVRRVLSHRGKKPPPTLGATETERRA